MKTDGTQDRVDQRLHQHYMKWFEGDGATTEFRLDRNIATLDAVEVWVDGALKRPDAPGTAYDYKVRGITNGYTGDQNAIKFAVAPPNGKNVGVRIVAT